MGTPKHQASIQKELNLVVRQEQALHKAAMEDEFARQSAGKGLF